MPTSTLGYDASMSRWLFLTGVLVAAVGCTKQNPAAKCSTGTCTDPAAPFCDVDGTIGGTPGTCLGVSCTTGTFAACRGDVALTCNAMGNNYDELQCAMGCTPEAMGCKLCQAGQTVCTNGEVQTCDMNGAVTSSQACPLGCFESQPRCRDVDPSNALGVYEDMVASPPDVTITNGDIDTGTGTVTDGGTPVSIPSFEVAAPTGGASLRVFVVNTLTIQNATVHDLGSGPPYGAGHAIAIVSKGDITISGALTITPGTGGYVETGCNGGNGVSTDNGNEYRAAAGGGGANATDGARGGNVTSSSGGVFDTGGTKGSASGTATLIPLRGGCPGGETLQSPSPSTYCSSGGGAIQLTSAAQVVVNGTIDVRGSVGRTEFFQGQTGNAEAACGGGAGGGILVEAPRVTFGSSASLLATGGDGGALCTTNMNACGAAGHGATSGVGATAGADVVDYGTYNETSGGGGGGLGRIRINTPDQTYTKSNTTIEDGALTVGTLATR